MGILNSIKIWHDNSGRGDEASWFLKYIIVYDLQTREKFYFVCEEWLAAEKGDGKIERNIISVSENEFRNLKRNNERLIDLFSDFHLWYSVFSKPIGSLFTRFNRVTCCFLSVYASMLLTTIYYTTNLVVLKKTILISDVTQEQVHFEI